MVSRSSPFPALVRPSGALPELGGSRRASLAFALLAFGFRSGGVTVRVLRQHAYRRGTPQDAASVARSIPVA